MNVPRDVVRDLLPVYLAGDASPASRSLVEEFIAKDPAIASLAAESESLLPAAPEPLPDEEIAVIRRTKRVVRTRSLLLAAAVFVTMLPASMRFGPAGVQWVAVERPDLSLAAAAVAVLLWAAYAVQTRKLRVAGL